MPLGEVADIRMTQGATSIRTENAKLATYFFVDIRGRDLGGYVADAKNAVAEQIKFPPGTYVLWATVEICRDESGEAAVSFSAGPSSRN